MMTEPEQPMMYSTPTLDRRPRPPGSVPHRSISNAITNSPASGSSSTETPLSRQLYTRKLHSSPAMEETRGKEVMGLGLSTSTPSQTSSTITRDKTGHDIAQPSPPPPYGPIPTALLGPLSTPPTQDIDDPLESVDESRHEEDEEEERRARATDLAKSLGLTLLSPSKLSTDENEEDGLDAEEIRKQLIQMKRRLKVRDHELVMAAQAAEYLLRQHEELVSGLPPHVKDRLPLLHNITTPRQSVNRETGRVPDQPSSSSSPVLGRISDDHSAPNNSPSRSSGKRLFRTVRNNDSSKPFPHHHHKQARNIFSTPSRPTFAETIQQESDERLILLERALSESRENEEVQRKLAARLKRDFEKLQRDFEHAEQTMAEQVEERPKARSMDSTSSIESVTSSQFDSWAWKQTLNSDGEEDVKRVLRPKATRVKLRIKPKKVEREQLDMRDESDSAWGLTRFPSFPGEAGSSIGDRLTRLPPRPTFNRLKAKLRQPSPTKATSRHTQSASDDDLPVPSSRRETPSRSTRGRYPRAGMSNETSRSKSRSTSIHRVRDSPSRNAVTSSRQQTPLPGRYDSISSQLASVRKFVSESVRSVGFNGSRSLGSELGSEYGDHDHTSNEFEPVKKEQDGKDMWEDENTTASDSTDGVFSRPISIPAKASSGLSSLAMALSCSPVSKVKTPRRSPTRSPVDDLDPGSYRPKKGRRNWIRPLLLSQRYDTRPAMYPRSSSDGTVALAHRRQRSGKEELYDLVREISSRDGAERRERRLELYSPPARLVNDLIILLSILLEWIEMFVVIVYRVSVAVKYGRESIFRTWRQGRSKRYYL